MEITLKLQPEYYNYILSGTKRIELRLFDEKRQLINIGDTIKILKEPDLKDYFYVKVIGLLRYKSFEDLINDFDISVLADKSVDKPKLLNDLNTYYPKEKQKEYGVLGIRIELE